MKIRCIKLLDGFGQPVARSGWASVGRVYHVLEILTSPQQTEFRMVGDEPTPALFHVEMFELVSGVVPPEWIVSSSGPGHFRIGPKSWSAQGFWQAYFDDNADALAAFQEGVAAIRDSDP